MVKKLKWVILGLAVMIYLLLLDIFKNQVWGFITGLLIFVVYVIVIRLRVDNRKKTFYIITAAMLLLLVLNAVISAPLTQLVMAGNGEKNGFSEVIDVEQGKVLGILNDEGTVEIFTGIPYAKPPVGELRWRAPEPAESWDGVRICDTFAPMAMQKRGNAIYSYGAKVVGYHENPISLRDNFLEAMSEDCLYLNIWKPANVKAGDDVPVLFYIHGGSLNSGQTYFDAYNGESFANKGIIVVNIAYRLGVFGYLADEELRAESKDKTTGNYGLLDQIAALKWVNENIKAFGGDANNITIAGESAGSSSVNAICVSPLAKGLFRRAIAESSGITPKNPYHTFRTIEDAKSVAADIKKEFNCSTVDELRLIPAEKLVNTAYQNNEMTVDGYAIAEQPYLTYLAGNNNEESVLGGYNGTEAESFLLFNKKPGVENYEENLRIITGEYASEMASIMPVTTDEEAKANFIDVVGMAWFGYSHYDWSNLMMAENRPAYLYYFTKKNKALGDWHSGELPYFYGNIKSNGNYDETDFALSEMIQEYILNYVRSGDPNGEGLPEWETYNSNPKMVMHLDTVVQMEENQYIPVFKVFDKYMNDYSE